MNGATILETVSKTSGLIGELITKVKDRQAVALAQQIQSYHQTISDHIFLAKKEILSLSETVSELKAAVRDLQRENADLIKSNSDATKANMEAIAKCQAESREAIAKITADDSDPKFMISDEGAMPPPHNFV